MKALVLTQYDQLDLLEVRQPDLGPEDVLIRVHSCGICGSDVHGMDGSTGRRRPPVIMGHEASGTIVHVGSAVEGWSEGDRVTFDSTIYCGRCWHCAAGRINLCDNRRVLGVSCDEYRQDGAYAELVAVPQRILYRLPEGLSFERAALVEPLSIAFHAVNRTPIRLDDTAVVVGTGMVGLLVVQSLRAAGCGRIIAVDLSQDRLDLACRLGADEGLRADTTDVVAQVHHRTGGRGADVVLEVVGVTSTVQLAVACARKGGQVTLVGNLSPSVELPLQASVTRELTLCGVCASCGEYPACLDMIARDAVKVDPLLSAVAPLEQGPQWFRRLQQGEAGLLKVVLQP